MIKILAMQFLFNLSSLRSVSAGNKLCGVDHAYYRFRSDLVTNFAYRFQHCRDDPEECFRWPSRNGVVEA